MPPDVIVPGVTHWRTTYPLFTVELVLAYCAFGWSLVGLYTGLTHRKTSPSGSAFIAAAQFTGSWHVLTALLIATATTSTVGIITDWRRLRRIGLGLSAFAWGFIAAGLSTRGAISTAVVIYPALTALAIATWLTVPGSPRDR
jgi:hypothetical protein